MLLANLPFLAPLHHHHRKNGTFGHHGQVCCVRFRRPNDPVQMSDMFGIAHILVINEPYDLIGWPQGTTDFNDLTLKIFVK